MTVRLLGIVSGQSNNTAKGLVVPMSEQLYRIEVDRQALRDIAGSSGVTTATLFWILDDLRNTVLKPVERCVHGKYSEHTYHEKYEGELTCGGAHLDDER